MPRLSIIIPAYNEEKRLPRTLDSLDEYLRTAPFEAEIIVVDDGSADGTKKITDEAAARFPAVRAVSNGINRGKGYSVRHGIREAKGDILLFYDADSSTPIGEVEKFFRAFDEGADVTIGSRSLPGSDVRVRQPWYRETMGRIFNLMVRLFILSGIVDTQCGFKAFKREAAARIFERQRLAGFSFDVEVLFIARKLGYRISEVPIVWINSPSSSVHPIWDSLKMFAELLKIRINSLRGFYRSRETQE
jgi:dolichyl-phosphate beta-glucosyltransferase